MVIWKRDLVSTISKLEYLPTGYVSPGVDDLHGVLITFRMGKYLRCDHHAAFGSPTGFVLVSGTHAFMVVFRPGADGLNRCWRWVSLLAALSRLVSRSSLVRPYRSDHNLSDHCAQRCDAWQPSLRKSSLYSKRCSGCHLSPQNSASSHCMINFIVWHLFVRELNWD